KFGCRAARSRSVPAPRSTPAESARACRSRSDSDDGCRAHSARGSIGRNRVAVASLDAIDDLAGSRHAVGAQIALRAFARCGWIPRLHLEPSRILAQTRELGLGAHPLALQQPQSIEAVRAEKAGPHQPEAEDRNRPSHAA